MVETIFVIAFLLCYGGIMLIFLNRWYEQSIKEVRKENEPLRDYINTFKAEKDAEQKRMQREPWHATMQEEICETLQNIEQFTDECDIRLTMTDGKVIVLNVGDVRKNHRIEFINADYMVFLTADAHRCLINIYSIDIVDIGRAQEDKQ